ncbi:histidine phosphatase family protein [Phaeobacter italicus]|jgi:broad specificity phosphatase PhoE|uniref:histidine phosphatase family protein n=1 Tax=Phaeobacter italicus TaxID=481446 RepID=UPI002FDB60AD
MTQMIFHLVRHGKVDSHRGDVPIADDAYIDIDKTASLIAAQCEPDEVISFFATKTKRSRETAIGLSRRIKELLPGVTCLDLIEEYAIRNPDLYLAGHRVEMVSTGSALAAQLPNGTLTAEDAERHPFFGKFFRAPDRIEYWLNHQDPPGENATAVARRIVSFARSLGDSHGAASARIVAVSHSPVMRAVLTEFCNLDDPGEPDWVESIDITIQGNALNVAFRNR